MIGACRWSGSRVSKPSCAQARDQELAVLAVARAAARGAALGGVLGQRLIEGGQHVGRRGEAPLAGALHRLPLVVEVEREAGRIALGRAQRRRPDDREAEPRHALQALVGRGREPVERHALRIERQRAEGAHGIDQQPPAMARGDLGDPLDRVQDARGGLALDGGDVADRGVGRERPIERRRIVRPVLRGRQRHHRPAVVARHPDHALAIGAVDQHQKLAVAGHEGPEHRLDHEGAAALERHGDVTAFGAGELDQARPHSGVELDEVAIARAPVAQHRLLDGQRTWSADRASADRAHRGCQATGAPSASDCRWHILRIRRPINQMHSSDGAIG